MDASVHPPARLPQVRLGKTGIRGSLVAMGTGTIGSNHSSNQTRLGQDRFIAIVHHAYERGITYFDCADQYGSNPYVGKAIKDLPRKSLTLSTKTNSRTAEAVRSDVERFLNEFETDYIDVVLLHCMVQSDWSTGLRGAMEALDELKRQRKIRAHGVSVHSFGALETAVADKWTDVVMVRHNPWGRMMDAPPGETAQSAAPKLHEVLKRQKDSGRGVVGIKILAEGRAVRGADKLDRIHESVKYSIESGVIDTMVIGLESEQQVDEVVDLTLKSLEEVRKK
jgi:predicted aldo/keto reductase-like oxidoreductase